MATPPLPPPTPPNYKPIYPLIEKKLTTEKNWSLTKCRNTFMKDGGYLWQERNFKKEGMDTHHFEAEREMWIHYCKLDTVAPLHLRGRADLSSSE